MINSATHKALHAAVGAAMGAALDDEDRLGGALSGAISAVVVECVAEVLSSHMEQVAKELRQENPSMSYDEAREALKDILKRNANIAKLTVATVALLTGQDVDVAIETSRNAIENNFEGAYIPWLVDVAMENWALEEVKEALTQNGKKNLLKVADIIDGFFQNEMNVEYLLLCMDGCSESKSHSEGNITRKTKGGKVKFNHTISRKRMGNAKEWAKGGTDILRSIAKDGIGVTQKKLLQKARKRFGIKGDEFQIHHIISNKHKATKDHDLWKKSGINPDDHVMFMPTKKGKKVTTTYRGLHQGRHDDAISREHAKRMNKIIDEGRINNWRQEQYKDAFKKLLREERKKLKDGEVKLNNAQVGQK